MICRGRAYRPGTAGIPPGHLVSQGGRQRDVLYQAVGVPILGPEGTDPYGALVAAVPIDRRPSFVGGK